MFFLGTNIGVLYSLKLSHPADFENDQYGGGRYKKCALWQFFQILQIQWLGDSKLIETVLKVHMSPKVFILVLAININSTMMYFLMNFPIQMKIMIGFCIAAIFF